MRTTYELTASGKEFTFPQPVCAVDARLINRKRKPSTTSRDSCSKSSNDEREVKNDDLL